MTEATHDVESAAPTDNGTAEEAMQALLDLSAPQPQYRKLIDQGGLIDAIEGIRVGFSRQICEHVLRHHELFSSQVDLGLGNVRPLIPLNVDPPQHSKYRKILDPLFAPRRMDEQEEDITRRVNALIDAFIDRGECNFSEQFAQLFPTSVFLGLMGLPEDELSMFLRLRDGVLRPETIDGDAAFDPEKRRAVQDATGQEMYAYFGGLMDERQKTPTGDIVSRFLAAEVDGEKLSREDILDILYLFMIAGLDTVTDSLTCFYAFLATHPEHRRQLVENPSIIPSAVEELLRWESPVPSGVPRMAREDTELPGGHKVPSGTAIMVSYGAANVDPSAFVDPSDVRLDRTPNPHIAFGAGVHRCLGSHLARRELRVALREWHRRIPEYRIKPGHEKLEYEAGLRHVKDLVLCW